MTIEELQELVTSTDKRAATLTSGVRLVRTAPYEDPRRDPRVDEIYFCEKWRKEELYGPMYTIWIRTDGDSNEIPERFREQDGDIVLLYHTLDYWTDEISVQEYYELGLPTVAGKDLPMWM